MESMGAHVIACFKIVGFELLIMAACAAASAVLITVWRYREVHGIEEPALKILLSASLGLGIAVVASTVENVPGWLFILNMVSSALVGCLVAMKCPNLNDLESLGAFFKGWTASSPAVTEHQPEIKFPRLPLSALPALKKAFATDAKDSSEPLTGITYLRKMRAVRTTDF